VIHTQLTCGPGLTSLPSHPDTDTQPAITIATPYLPYYIFTYSRQLRVVLTYADINTPDLTYSHYFCFAKLKKKMNIYIYIHCTCILYDITLVLLTCVIPEVPVNQSLVCVHPHRNGRLNAKPCPLTRIMGVRHNVNLSK